MASIWRNFLLGNPFGSVLLAACVPALLAACDGGGSGGSSGRTGTFSLAVTDGPVDSAAKVVVEFTGLSIKPENGEVVSFPFAEPRQIDLLQLQGSASSALVSGEVVAAGRYEWMRLHVNAAQDGVLDSYLESLDGTQRELRIPSGSETGLKLVRGFTVPVGGSADFTIDFDLRKSITSPPGLASVILKPVLRLVDNVSVGSIIGILTAELVDSACADPAVDDGAVYVYAGANAAPMDIRGVSGDPVATALVNVVDGEYRYEVGFLTEGDYTLAYTCEAVADDPAITNSLAFVAGASVPVVAGLPTSYDFVIVVNDEDIAN